MKQKILMVLGPTATGKTHFAVNLAAAVNGEIIGADSRQVYRGLDIGSGKDISEYTLPDGTQVPYHLIDV
ncbi:MAG: tRNA (adenosine(37)-N6)-dimethylallyltransferase MiaA, partial [Lentisphaeria bacterium]|nr:tRNA (adenosine(37)-N6)-dimethylallyltransferase MiaA [Lentisphaeria bacterium]